MDRRIEWTETRQELSEASKAVHRWDTMPMEVRPRLGVGKHREERAEARRRFEQADRPCPEASVANRIALRFERMRDGRAA